MSITRAALGLAMAALLLLGSGPVAPHITRGATRRAPATPVGSAFLERAGAAVPPAAADLPDADEGAAEGQVDLSGNDVTDAVATYRFGRDGILYEAHSPQTELARLGPPKS